MFSFYVKLIKVNPEQSENAKKSLEGNCTHVSGNYYIFEGEIECLSDDGVKFKEIENGVVGGLGGLTEDELIQVCLDSFDYEIKN